MRIFVIGLDGASPEILLSNERLVNFRRLMELGCYGKLKSVIPAGLIPGWMCMATSQDPGSLGVYADRNRANHSYNSLMDANELNIQEMTIWDQIGRAGGRSILIGVPSNSSFDGNIELYKDWFFDKITVNPADNLQKYKDQIIESNRSQFQWLSSLMQEKEWNYFHFIDTGLNRIQNAFWQFFDPSHPFYQSDNPYQDVIPEYYQHLDEQIGSLLEQVSDDTIVLVASVNGTQNLVGEFCTNEWLIRENYLVLNRYPAQVTTFDQLDINWKLTTAWSNSGDYAPVFLNINGREPVGIIEKSDVLAFRERLKNNFETLMNEHGKPMENRVYKPEEIYENIRQVSPDLIVYLADLGYKSNGEVGHSKIFKPINSSNHANCAPSANSSFVLASVNNPLQGELHEIQLIDLAPTLLDLAGFDIPVSMQGRSIISRFDSKKTEKSELTRNEHDILRERLSGLGYIS